MKKLKLITLVLSLTLITACSAEKSDEKKYAEAVSLYEEAKFEEAKEIFVALDDYEDSINYITYCNTMTILQGIWNDTGVAKNWPIDISGFTCTGLIKKKNQWDISINGSYVETTKGGETIQWTLSNKNGTYVLTSVSGIIKLTKVQ